MRLWPALFAACAGKGADVPIDTSYPGIPEVLAVSAACDGDNDFVVRARLVGWSEEGVLQIWSGSDVTVPPILEEKVSSTGFRSDEWCDLIEGPLPKDDPALPACEGDFATGYTALLRVSFEAGCAGEQAVGAGAAAALGGGVTDPTDLDGTCPAPMSEDWFKEDPLPSLESDVVDYVPPCDEPY